MWSAQRDKLVDANGLRFVVTFNSYSATFADVFGAWQIDAEFRTLFNSLLADVPFTAFRWELPAVTNDRLAQPFECVVLDSPGLDRLPDITAFSEYFKNSAEDVVSFTNLGRDATLVVPRPIALPNAYGHLASFVRLAPESQRDQIWRTGGETMAERMGAKPVWLSTAGAGVPWLHVRFDDRPKYYSYQAYRQI